jgi:hypothetical protein
MNLAKARQRLLAGWSGNFMIVPGGSAANTMF